MITIDGSQGEGGGQILRSSLALSMLTGTPFRIEKIRAGRKKPGLLRQHLTAVQAATCVCQARVTGDEIGATRVTFEPSEVRGGEYAFSIGTAGSTTLVLQTVLLPLLTAKTPSRIVLEGGTHNPHAPPFDFLERAYLPLVNRMGPKVRATLEQTGFFPAGGGRIVVEVEPAPTLTGFELLERGALKRRLARATVSRLPVDIAERELHLVSKRLGWSDAELQTHEERTSPGPGNVVILVLEHEHVTEVFTGFGEVGRAAETVAADATQACESYLKSNAPAGEYLTDQIMLPLAAAGSGAFRATGLSRHARTHLDLIARFLPVPIREEGEKGGGMRLIFGS
ncbi:MAG: RNA 3'-terminal phosphate cyclase [Phycisphaerae bacterium]|nr:MAG: RNA 3'-terminal phosphate cyclase [Planctomycetota bacterium]KAB2949883.1 MAG: RNA 3'-terminal phosphate cyclase [Phycisphaerae bacterium]MBE7457595.1 RNA 3'-terminal phosphate cyclase [Planctomycetia bacterium]MCK6464634.1 RNA 3'-terminal phosphate cyclase [Phycisphaerae bacterium]MCL4717397.1 RNA 3'-terminal phosphate cyclase [Phycisphaerae bacterium]